jgi:hypothetical protein
VVASVPTPLLEPSPVRVPLQRPLYIYNSKNERTANALFSPRWGGIYIVNPDEASCETHTFRPDLQSITSVFAVQLSKMLKMGGMEAQDLMELQRRKTEDMVDSTRRL